MHVGRKEQTWPVWDSSTLPGGSWVWTAVMEAGYKMAVCVFLSLPRGSVAGESQSQGSTVLDSQPRVYVFMEHTATGKLPTPLALICKRHH